MSGFTTGVFAGALAGTAVSFQQPPVAQTNMESGEG